MTYFASERTLKQFSAFQSGTQSALPSGLYFGKEGGSELNTNVRINKLNEWSYDKLGWMKIIGII